MKRFKFFLPILICLIFLAVGCNNSGSDEKDTAADTTKPTDTIQSDPSTFSPPH